LEGRSSAFGSVNVLSRSPPDGCLQIEMSEVPATGDSSALRERPDRDTANSLGPVNEEYRRDVVPVPDISSTISSDNPVSIVAAADPEDEAIQSSAGDGLLFHFDYSLILFSRESHRFSSRTRDKSVLRENRESGRQKSFAHGAQRPGTELVVFLP